MKSTSAKDRIILALDVINLDEAKKLIDELYEYVGAFKVGLQLFLHEGPSLFEKLKHVPIFFDGKFHDIPNTVARAAEAIADQGVWMFNVHASGGCKMMQATVDASKAICQQSNKSIPKIIAVTVLTSINEDMMQNELGCKQSVNEQVCSLALLAKNSGLDGVVASASEVNMLRQACGPDFLLVTPGVRPSWANLDDQARVVTPCQAIANGADYLVIGRPITGANNRREATQRIIEEIGQAF